MPPNDESRPPRGGHELNRPNGDSRFHYTLDFALQTQWDEVEEPVAQ